MFICTFVSLGLTHLLLLLLSKVFVNNLIFRDATAKRIFSYFSLISFTVVLLAWMCSFQVVFTYLFVACVCALLSVYFLFCRITRRLLSGIIFGVLREVLLSHSIHIHIYKMSVLIAGATGAIGHFVVQKSLSEAFSNETRKVVAFSRQAVTTENPVEKMFNFPPATAASSSVDLNRLEVVTFDWEHFMRFWDTFSHTSIEEQRMMEGMESGPECASTPICNGSAELDETRRACEEDVNDNSNIATEADSSSKGKGGALLPTSRVANPYSTFYELKKEYDHYKNIFSQHEYAAICLGTTRKQAGSKENFIRCDFSYALAFLEALLCFSAPAGWDVYGKKATPSILSPRKKIYLTEKQGDSSSSLGCSQVEETRLYRLPSWLMYRVGSPTFPTSSSSISRSPKVAQDVLSYYSQDHIQRDVMGVLSSRSSQSLKGITLVSSSGANPFSSIFYFQVKGALESAMAERVLLHNTILRGQLRNSSLKSIPSCSPVQLSIFRPGLLDRGAKSRPMERLWNLLSFYTGLKVEVAAAAVLKSFHWCKAFSQSSLQKTCEQYPGAKFYPNKKVFEEVGEPFFVFSNDGIRKLAKSSACAPASL